MLLSTLTPPPRRDNPFDLPDTTPSLDDRTAWRRWATRESYSMARNEVTAAGPLIPEADDAQAAAEAQIMATLINEYGMHRPFTTGGPYGIVSVTPRRHVLRVRISDGHLPRWSCALTAALGSPEASVPSVEVTRDGLALAGLGARIELLDITEAQWRSAAANASAEGGARRPLEEELAGQMSATLRRIGLLWDVAERYSTVELRLVGHAGTTYLLDVSPGPHLPSVIPLWSALSLPLELWPCPPAPAVIDPRAAVLAAVNATHPPCAASDPALALCHLADIEAVEVSLRLADRALNVAQSVLTDPAYTSVWDGGGWAGNCRRRDGSERFVAHEDEFLPPGTESLLMTPEADVVELGQVVLRPYHPELGPEHLVGEEIFEVPHSWGTSAYIDMLDWALAAATSPPPKQAAPSQLTVVDDGGLRAAASRAREQITQAHEAIENAATHSKHRHEHTHRLLQPVPVAAGVDPSISDLILAAHERDVLNIIPLLETLTYLWGRKSFAAGASDGHWSRDEGGPFPNSLTGTIGCWTNLPPGTLMGEEANTSPVDSTAFRRHLATHRSAFDPFVTCYLDAADSTAGRQDFEDRHQTGVEALRRADLTALQALDPRQPPRDNFRFLHFIASLPLGLHELNAWFDTAYPADGDTS